VLIISSNAGGQPFCKEERLFDVVPLRSRPRGQLPEHGCRHHRVRCPAGFPAVIYVLIRFHTRSCRSLGESFQLVILDLIRKVCKNNPLAKSQYIRYAARLPARRFLLTPSPCYMLQVHPLAGKQRVARSHLRGYFNYFVRAV
jgi:hypothetical protein